MRTIFLTDASAPENCPSIIAPHFSVRSEGALCEDSAKFDIGSFELVRRFVEHVVAKNAFESPGKERTLRSAIDWEVVEASVADTNSLEQAIGRAVVIADQMCRGAFEHSHLDAGPWSIQTEDAFFGFSVADVAPDFGDGSRYRTRMARSMARIFGIRRTLAMTEGGTS
jgi:hypothetical protein